MSSIQSIETPQDYVNYTFNLSSRGITEVTSELTGMSSTVSNLMGLMAFKTSEYLSNTESILISFGYAAVTSFTKATQQAIQFEQALANVKAIGGESINEIEIGQAAMKYSNQLGMGVTSMTEGLEALSRAGLTATDVMSNVLAEGVKLSKLEGMDLEESINSLISTTNLLAEGGYDVNSQEYADMVKAMNQHIVSTSESAPINAHNIIQTLQHVGGYASASGIDQDDLFAVIAQLGSKGTKGEMAGTALRAFVAAGQKDSAQRALKRIGLDVSDLWTDSGEAMLPISEMKAVLDEALESRGYSKQEKLEFYSDFAGYKQANQIMKINTEEVKEYKKSIDSAWDLGTKLNTILGTVHSNIQIIAQTTTNFLTRVGQTALPILNAILQPIKWTVQLIDALPFSEQIVGIGLAFLGLKGTLIFINRVIPAIASLYTSFDKGEQKAKGIAGHFKNLKNDVLETKELLENIHNPEFLATKRIENDKYGMGSVAYGMSIAEVMYESLRGSDITGKDFWELPKYQRNQFIDYTSTLGKDTQFYKAAQEQIDKENNALAQAIINNVAKSQPYVYTSDNDNWTGNVERNQEINLQAQSYKDNTNQIKQGNNIALSTKQTVDSVYNATKELISHIKGHTDNTKQYDIGKGIMSVAKPFADILAEAIFKRFNLKDFNTRVGKIQFDNDIGEQASQELENIFKKVQDSASDLPDISFYYGNNIDEMTDKVQALHQEIVNTAKIFSNTDTSNMSSYQGRRALKTIDINAVGNIGLNYSKMMNEAYIREILKQNKFDKNNKFIEKIYDEQVTKLAESLDVDISQAKNKTQALKKIYNKFHSKDNTQTISEVIAEATKWYSDELVNRKMPSKNVTQWLSNEDSAYIMQRLNVPYDTSNTNTTQQLQEYFSNNNVDAQTKWIAQQLTLAIQKSKSEGIYSGPEAAELEYMVTHLEALQKSIQRLSGLPSNITELAEIFYELGPQDFEKYKKDILTGGALISTPTPLKETPWGDFNDQEDIDNAYKENRIDADTKAELTRQLWLDPSERQLKQQLDNSGAFIIDIDDREIYQELLADIKTAITNFDLTPITTILTDIKKIIESFNTSSSLIPTPNDAQPNTVIFNISGDFNVNGDSNQLFSSDTQGSIIDVNGYVDDSRTIGPEIITSIDTQEQKNNSDIYDAATLSVMAMLQTLTDNVQFEIDSLRDFVSTFLLFKKGVEIIEQKTNEQKQRAQDVTDDFNVLTQGIHNQWLILAGIVQSFINMFQEQENQENELNSLIQELTTNTRNFAEYLLGHSFISVEDVNDELSEYVKDTIKNVIDAVFNPPEKLVQIPESNGAIEDLKDTNKEDRKKGWRNPVSEKDSGEEVIIGSYRIPMDDNYPNVPPNLMSRGYPEVIKEQLHTNAINRMTEKDTDIQAQRYARAKAKSDGQQAIDDLMNMRHGMYTEIAKKHTTDPNSVTEDELDFIGLNKKRDERRLDYFKLLRADSVIAGEEKHQQNIQDKERREKNKRGATNDLVQDRDYPTPIGPQSAPKISGKEMAAKILNTSPDELKNFDDLAENRRNQKYVDFVDKNIVTEGPAYLPTAMKPTTGEGIAATIRAEKYFEKENKRAIDLVEKNFINNEKPLDFSGVYRRGSTIIGNGDLSIDNMQKAANALNMFEVQNQKQNELKQAQERYRNNTASNEDLILLGITTPSRIEEERGEQKAESLQREQENVKSLYQKYDRQHRYMQYEREGLPLKTFMENALKVQEEYDKEQMLRQEEERERQRKNIKRGRDVAHYQQYIGDFGTKENAWGDSALDAGPAFATLFGAVDGDKKSRLQFLKNVEYVGGELSPEEKVEKFALRGALLKGNILDRLPQGSDESLAKGEQYRESIHNITEKMNSGIQRLHSFNDALYRMGEIFPPLTTAAWGLETVLSVMEGVTSVLSFVEDLLSVSKVTDTLVSWGLFTAEEAETIAKGTAAGTTWLLTGAIGALEALLAGPVLVVIGIIIAALAILYISEKNHAEALKANQKALEESKKSVDTAKAAYKSARNARKAETDATRRHIKTLKESVALNKLASERRKRLSEVEKKAILQSDPLWGENNSVRTGLQTGRVPAIGGAGIIAKLLSGKYENISDKHSDNIKQITTIVDLDNTSGGWQNFGQNFWDNYDSQYANQVNAYYQEHTREFARMDEFAPELEKLYQVETEAQKIYGKENARNSEMFLKAAQDIADTTGLDGQELAQYLDYMQTEANVENAREAAGVGFGKIQAEIQQDVMKILYPDGNSMGDLDNIQNAMVMAAVEDEARKAKTELWQSAMLEVTQAIYAALRLDFDGADRHWNAAFTYYDGMQKIDENKQRIAEDSLAVAEAGLRKDYGTESYSYYGDTPFGAAVSSAKSAGMSVRNYGNSQSFSQSNTPSSTTSKTNNSLKQIQRETQNKASQANKTAQNNNSNDVSFLQQVGNLATGITDRALDFAKTFTSLFGGPSITEATSPTSEEQPTFNKYEINIKTININTEDDPEKIKTAFMNLMIELGEQIVPRNVSRTIGKPQTSNDNTQNTDNQNILNGTDSNDNKSNNTNT